MDTRTKLKLVGGAVGAAAGALGAWTLADALAKARVERVDYTHVTDVDGVELRRYPETVRVETTAPSERTAFRRLYRYIDGANDGGESVAMTTPVETGESVAMTAPVETEASDGDVTMSFFLPASYTPETAPEPSSDAVSLVVEPPKTLAVLSFSWWTPGVRVRKKESELLDALEATDIETVGAPALRRYDAPFTPPFRRTNEVAVEVESESVRRYLAGERST
ncbi:heme-binding protein [Salarchaeum sp. JOR-1]|uniref:SOUL family heme-binding protein n=1 Tax=Salarchaeum sp. JOR-1 TaxID=2599399 RepID=UPI0011988336|nr:heme-binding protein [Salarchaeum sp. JOR-1]QDX40128.1 heme-binding protein [Salarchaeum sp. JOR-1]